MGPDDALVLSFGEDVHDAAVTGGPVVFGDAVDENDVDVVNAEFFAEAVEIATEAGGVTVVGFGHDDDFVAGELLERSGDVGMAAV